MCSVGGNRSTWREPTHAQEEHANQISCILNALKKSLRTAENVHWDSEMNHIDFLAAKVIVIRLRLLLQRLLRILSECGQIWITFTV